MAVKKSRKLSIFVAGHVTPIYGPVQALVNHLCKNKSNFLFASLPFSYAKLPNAKLEEFISGKNKRILRGHRSVGPDPILWVKDFWFVLRMGRKYGSANQIPFFIGIDNLNAAAGIILRRLGAVEKVAYYVIDYTPRRFNNRLLNFIYHFVDRWCVRRADVVWNLSSRMKAIRAGQEVSSKRNKVVPVGVALNEVRHPLKKQVKRKTLVYMGALQAGKGIELLIETMPDILAQIPDAKLMIIGVGPLERALKKMVNKSPARKSIFMAGGMDHNKLFKKLPRYGIALSTYTESSDNYTYWADPTKPKEYLACGLPLIITRVPWIWKRVADPKRPMGIAISYHRKELAAACLKLLGDSSFYWRCRKNAVSFSQNLAWDKIFNKAFSEFGKLAPRIR